MDNLSKKFIRAAQSQSYIAGLERAIQIVKQAMPNSKDYKEETTLIETKTGLGEYIIAGLQNEINAHELSQ